MIKYFLPFIIILSARGGDLPLPNWIDHSREKMVREPIIIKGETVPPSIGFKLPAEYAPAKAVVLGNKSFSPMLTSIAKAVSNNGTEVWITGEKLNIEVKNKQLIKEIDCRLNTVWMRDYGPVGITETGELAVVDSIYRHYQYRVSDDNAPKCIADNFDIVSFDMPIILDGGNLMVDSKGNLFMTKRTYSWNSNISKSKVDKILKEYFGVHTIHAIDYAGYPGTPKDGTGHIDMFVKLLNDETVLISTTDSPGFIDAVEKAVSYFRGIKTPTGKDYKIIRVPGWVENGSWYTYTNSLIVNNLVMVPGFSKHPKKNELAKKAYLKGRPEFQVKLINSDRSITYGGSIHCVTQLIPKN